MFISVKLSCWLRLAVRIYAHRLAAFNAMSSGNQQIHGAALLGHHQSHAHVTVSLPTSTYKSPLSEFYDVTTVSTLLSKLQVWTSQRDSPNKVLRGSAEHIFTSGYSTNMNCSTVQLNLAVPIATSHYKIETASHDLDCHDI
jgi:hypothetical protein